MKDEEKDGEEIEISVRHIGLRAVAFFLALALAVSGFGAGIRGLRARAEGYYPVEPKEDEEAIRYAGRVRLSCYFAGSSTEIRTAQNRLQREYGKLLIRYCRLLDPWERYEDSANLALLNRSPGETVHLDPVLLPLLREAVEKTEEGWGYSLYAGPFYREWDTLLYLDDPASLDPLVNPGEAERLRALAEVSALPDAFRLTLTDGAEPLARLDISQEARDRLEALEYEGPLLDFNLLREAYLLRLLAGELEALGYREGYLSGAEGTVLALSGNRGGEYCLYTLRDGQVEAAATASAAPDSAFSLLRTFPYPEERYGFYFLEAETDTGEKTTVRRYPFIPAGEELPADGETFISSACVLDTDAAGDPVTARCACLRLLFTGTPTPGESGRDGGLAIAWTAEDGSFIPGPGAEENFSAISGG